MESFQFNFGGSPFDFSFPELEDAPQFYRDVPRGEPLPPPVEQPKKKRKTTRI
jgi:hypothetical protein